RNPCPNGSCGRISRREKHLGRARGAYRGTVADGVEAHRTAARERNAGLRILADGTVSCLPQAREHGRRCETGAAGVERRLKFTFRVGDKRTRSLNTEEGMSEPYMSIQVLMMANRLNPPWGVL